MVTELNISGQEPPDNRRSIIRFEDTNEQKPKILNREQVAQRLPMYGDNKLLVDEFDTQEGIGNYTVREEDCDGHFANEYKEIKLFRATDQIEAAAQTLGLKYLESESGTKAVPFFRGIDGAKFSGFVFPGDKITMKTTITSQTRSGVKGDCEITIRGSVIATITGIDLLLVPNIKMAKIMIAIQKAARK